MTFIDELICNELRPFEQRMYFVKTHSLLNAAVTVTAMFTHNGIHIIATSCTGHYNMKSLWVKMALDHYRT